MSNVSRTRAEQCADAVFARIDKNRKDNVRAEKTELDAFFGQLRDWVEEHEDQDELPDWLLDLTESEEWTAGPEAERWAAENL